MGSSAFLPVSYFLLVLCTWLAEAGKPIRVWNVKNFGAVGDGKTDDSKALLGAWKQACEWTGKSKILIPKETFLVYPVVLSGPCNGRMILQVNGVVRAPGLDKFNSDAWLEFQYINGLTLTGPGIFDGQGPAAWSQNKCKDKSKCQQLPTSLRFSFVHDAIIQGISSIDSKSKHLTFFTCKNVVVQSIKIAAPADSPNTDGIYTSLSRRIQILRSVIATGDDCVAIGQGSYNITVAGVFCGPGHGISVGSLGKKPDEADVQDLVVRNCTFTNTDNGVRIKTWPDRPARNSVSDITFDDIVMNEVYNPILIDQQYCPHDQCSLKSPSKVRLRDITYRNIRGVSTSETAVLFLCSEEVPCENVELVNINLRFKGQGHSKSSCSNVNGVASGKQIPAPCF
ncbi:exopolygalacturonase-like [Aristolochia californica]|uniref:exopolygalacturonase-like n=1 Tax=Aristolochia californica TaxID=171875 RepID=UPI0035DBC4D6